MRLRITEKRHRDTAKTCIYLNIYIPTLVVVLCQLFTIILFSMGIVVYADYAAMPVACPGIRKGGGAKIWNVFFCFSIFQGGAQLRK